MNKIFTQGLLLLLVALLALACGEGDDGGTDGDVADGDGGVDGDADLDAEGAEPLYIPGTGRWVLEDTNAFDWYLAQEITALYFAIGDGALRFVKVREDGTTCEAQPLRPIGDNRWAPSDDPDNCWFELAIAANGKLEVYARHAEDPADQERPWYFVLNAIETIPGYAPASCTELLQCVHFLVDEQ